MPKIKRPLEKRLEEMSEDLQIGGDVNFRAMGIAVVLRKATDTLTTEEIKDMERLLSRSERLIRDLREFWDRHPRLDRLVDRGHLCAH